MLCGIELRNICQGGIRRFICMYTYGLTLKWGIYVSFSAFPVYQQPSSDSRNSMCNVSCKNWLSEGYVCCGQQMLKWTLYVCNDSNCICSFEVLAFCRPLYAKMLESAVEKLVFLPHDEFASSYDQEQQANFDRWSSILVISPLPLSWCAIGSEKNIVCEIQFDSCRLVKICLNAECNVNNAGIILDI